MNEEIKYVPLFPKQLEHWNESYEKFQQQINAIDHELENALKDQGPNPKNRPDGPEGYDTGMRERREEYLNSSRERRVKSYRSVIEKNIGVLDEKEGQVILSRYDYETSTNGFKNYTKENLKEVKSVDKEDKASFDYMAASHFNKYQQPEIAKAVEKENIEMWSDSYMDMLDQYRGRSSDVNKNIDDPEIEPQ